MKKRLIFIAFLSLTFISGCLDPDNYDDCVLKSMDEVKSDFAAKAIVSSCRSKFPPIRSEGVKLSKDQETLVNGKATFSGKYFIANVYNGNQDVSIQKITFDIGYENPLNHIDYRRLYNEVVEIPPLSTKEIMIDVNAPSNYTPNWFFSEIYGEVKK